MSNEAINYVLKNSQTQSSSRLLMVILADMANDDGECFPGNAKLSDKCNCKERNVQKLVDHCESVGELAVVENGGTSTKHGKTNLYVLLGLRYHHWSEVPGARQPKPIRRYGMSESTPDSNGVSKKTSHGVSKKTSKPSVEPSVKDKKHEKPFSDSIAISIRLLKVFVLRVSIQRILEVLEKENPAPPPTIYTPVFNAIAKHIHNIPQPESVTGKAVGVIRSIEKEVKTQFTAVFGEYHEGVAAYTIERLSKSAKYIQKYAAPFAVQYLSFLQLNEAKIRDVLLNGLLVQVPVEPPSQPSTQSTPATDEQYEAYELALQKAGM